MTSELSCFYICFCYRYCYLNERSFFGADSYSYNTCKYVTNFILYFYNFCNLHNIII